MDVSQGSGSQQPSRATRTTSAVSQAPSNKSRLAPSYQRRHDDLDSGEFVAWLITAVLLAFALAVFLTKPAKADIISSLGGGVKFNMSYLLEPDCRKAFVSQPSWPDNPRGAHGDIPAGEFSCGGDNPVFSGWPIAYQSPDGRLRIGWYHMSHWFDGGEFNWFGGDDAELHFNCICAEWTVNWTQRHRRRNK